MKTNLRSESQHPDASGPRQLDQLATGGELMRGGSLLRFLTTQPTTERNGMNGASREHSKGIIEDKIKRLETEILALKTIRDKIRWEDMDLVQEEAIWSYFIRRQP